MAETIKVITTGQTGPSSPASVVTFTPTGTIAATTVQAAIAEVSADVTDHLADTTDAHDASAISILDTANDFTATDVEGALAELQADAEADATALSDHLADTVDAHDASAISFTPVGTIAATDVQAAIAEVATDVAALPGTFAPLTDLDGFAAFIGGQADETPTVTNCTATAETTIKLLGVQSHKLAMAGAVTATASVTPLETSSVALSSLELLIYIEDTTKVTAVTVDLWNPSLGNGFTFNANQTKGWPLVNGWNRLRWPAARRASVGSPGAFGTVTSVRIAVVTNAATNVYIQQLGGVVRPKASLIFIHDGGYSTFDTSPGYADLKARGIPVTFAVDCGLIGDGTHVTEARLAELAAENGNSISFHGWDGTITSTMTAAQAQAATMKAIKWLARRGYSGRIWRSAWMQNTAPQAPSTNPLVLASAMYGNDNTERIEAWPFATPYGVPRYQFHARTTTDVDSWFTELQANHGVLVGYTHTVNAAGGSDITPTEWAYLLSKIDAGVAAGWLECVTLEMLLARSGIDVSKGWTGATAARWQSAISNSVTDSMVLPT